MTEEELRQCVLDMQTWLETNAGDVGKAFAAAPPADGDKVKSLPASAAGALQVGMDLLASLLLPLFSVAFSASVSALVSVSCKSLSVRHYAGVPMS